MPKQRSLFLLPVQSMALLLLPVLGAALAQNFTLSWASAPALANERN